MSKKAEIIAGLIQARQQILDAVVTLSPERQAEEFLGTWSIQDLLAHLVGWDYTNMEAVRDIRVGNSPGVFGYWDPEWATYNAELVKKFKHDDFDEMIKTIQRSHQALIQYIQTVPEEDIGKDFGIRSPNGRSITMQEFLQFEIDDEGRHYGQIREWLNRVS